MSDDWLQRFEASDRGRAQELYDRFVDGHADDPASWVASEIEEDIAQLARFLILRGIARRVRDGANEACSSALAVELRQQGAESSTLERFAKQLAYSLAFHVSYLIDEPTGTLWDKGERTDVRESDPRWRLMELDADDRLTGRDVGGLHESLYEVLDPDDTQTGDWFDGT